MGQHQTKSAWLGFENPPTEVEIGLTAQHVNNYTMSVVFIGFSWFKPHPRRFHSLSQKPQTVDRHKNTIEIDGSNPLSKKFKSTFRECFLSTILNCTVARLMCGKTGGLPRRQHRRPNHKPKNINAKTSRTPTTAIYMCFVDFTKAFDNISHEQM